MLLGLFTEGSYSPCLPFSWWHLYPLPHLVPTQLTPWRQTSTTSRTGKTARRKRSLWWTLAQIKTLLHGVLLESVLPIKIQVLPSLLFKMKPSRLIGCQPYLAHASGQHQPSDNPFGWLKPKIVSLNTSLNLPFCLGIHISHKVTISKLKSVISSAVIQRKFRLLIGYLSTARFQRLLSARKSRSQWMVLQCQSVE